ncbi:MAG: transglutaminase-like cysteine peptidase [Rickettsiales bacterium]|nr:transglutaminase-like cysteine peptidase [Rickettsiales bacterium]
MKMHCVYQIAGMMIALLCFSTQTIAAESNAQLLLPSTRSASLKSFPKWTTMVDRYVTQKKVPIEKCNIVSYQPCAALKLWRDMLERVRGESFAKQIELVNDWANEHDYVIDQINWGTEDFWATPNEFMTINGDCEDYAIAKYYSLRALGIPKNRLRIIIVQDFNLGGIIHAILGVYESDALYILDNQVKQVMQAQKIYHYRPIYSINEEYWWLYSPGQS